MSKELTGKEVEKLFCAAVLQEGPEVTQRVMERFTDYRDRSDQVLAELAGKKGGAKIGFFSQNAAKYHGSSFYKRADGTEVEVTGVFDTEERGNREYKWEDKVCVGQVEAWSREGMPDLSLKER